MITIFGLLFCLVVFFVFKRRDLFKFNFKKACRYMLVDVIVISILSSGLDYAGINKIEDPMDGVTYEMQQMIKNTSILGISLAGFEDAIFVLPLLVLPQVRVIKYVGIAAMSYLFMRGHDYQGRRAMLVKVGCIPIAYYFASRYGILTTMASHAAKDMIALSAIKFKIWLYNKQLEEEPKPIR